MKIITHDTSKAPEWHARRAKGIGGSEIGTLLGVNKWGCGRSIYYDKQPQAAMTAENNAMRRGSLLEGWILDKWSVAQESTPEIAPLIRRDNLPACVQGTPDAVCVLDNELCTIEVKLMSAKRWEALESAAVAVSDAVAFELAGEQAVRMQADYYARIYGATRCIVLACNLETLNIIEVEWKAPADDALFSIAEDWWEKHIVGETVPERLAEGDNRCFDCPHASACWADTTLTLDDDSISSDSDELESAVGAYRNATALAKEAANEKKDAQGRIKNAMHGHDKVAHTAGFVCTVTHSTRSSIDSKALKAAHPEIVEQFRKETEVATLRVK
jgi:predicted phage-related endonuclease